MTCPITLKNALNLNPRQHFWAEFLVAFIYFNPVISHIFLQFKWGPLPKSCTCECSATQLQQLAIANSSADGEGHKAKRETPFREEGRGWKGIF